ncbi:MAG: universal stress protein [Roseitalea sp.]|nr:universal stress protein [Roseitalea sp.]MBO6723241.1 universal stress protein [Roseitalea sp.]MBO6744415.1 universal stress protein [Roseitalea sp.]
MFKTIIAAYDGSDHAQQALAVACDLTSKYGAALHIAHTPQVASETMMVGYSAVPLPPSAEELEKAGAEAMQKAVAIAREHGVDDVVTHVQPGDPGRAIVEYAKAENADLIVMGRRGLGDFGSLLVGSITHKVSQLAECAVLTVK